jgi:serine/threonine protein kinase
MDSYKKLVSPTELEFYMIASSHNIAPTFISSELDSSQPKRFLLSTKLFPEMIDNVMRDSSRASEALFIISKARKLISSLHDISEENIVYDKETSSVAIIDFGLSRYIASITTDEIPNCIENLYEGVRYAGEPSNTIEYLLCVELGILTFLEKHIAK